MKERIFKVSDMVCTNCPMHLQALEDELPGVLEVNASYQKMEMAVKFDENRVSEDQIVAAVKTLGYSAHPVE